MAFGSVGSTWSPERNFTARISLIVSLSVQEEWIHLSRSFVKLIYVKLIYYKPICVCY